MISSSLHLVCSGYTALALKLYPNLIIIVALFAAVTVGCSYCMKCPRCLELCNNIGYTALCQLYPVIK